MARSQPLMIWIATGDPRPIGRQIADGIRMKVATGELDPGVQIPSVRALAQQLAVNPNTVAKVYSELTIEGWLEFAARPRPVRRDAEAAAERRRAGTAPARRDRPLHQRNDRARLSAR